MTNFFIQFEDFSCQEIRQITTALQKKKKPPKNRLYIIACINPAGQNVHNSHSRINTTKGHVFFTCCFQVASFSFFCFTEVVSSCHKQGNSQTLNFLHTSGQINQRFRYQESQSTKEITLQPVTLIVRDALLQWSLLPSLIETSNDDIAVGEQK